MAGVIHLTFSVLFDPKFIAYALLFLGCQVFESVEAVDPIESEPRPEEGDVKPSSPVKDATNATAASPQLPSFNASSPGLSNPGLENRPLVTESADESTTAHSTAGVSDVLNEDIKAGSQPGGTDVVEPVAKDKVSEMEEMETVSQKEVVGDKEVSESKETSEAEKKPEVEEKDLATNEPSKDFKAVDTNMNIRSAPENTNVLKLETEIHNEYFQAPPLGQTLSFQAHKSKDVEVEPLCPPAAEIKPETSETPPEITSQTIKTTESERKEAEATLCDLAETKKDKPVEIPFEKPDSNSPVRQVLNALQTSLTLTSHSRRSPDTADSDDSPSALEMEDIPSGITYVTSEHIKCRPFAGLSAPPMSPAQRERMASEGLVLDHHLDTACNTSPEGTDPGLSEEEPEMDNVLTEAEAAEVVEDTKHDESSEEQTYSVSIKYDN